MLDGMIRCVHGPNEQWLPIRGRTIGWVRINLRAALSLGYYSEAYINGRPVAHATALASGNDLEFLCRFGFKGSSDVPAETHRAQGLYATYPELARIGEEVRMMALDADSAVRVTLTLVAQFLEHRFGPLPPSELPTLGIVVEMLTRIEGRLVTFPRSDGRYLDGPPMSIKQASEAVNLSETHLRRAISKGELAAINVGSAGRSTWRIAHRDLEAWVQTKKGGPPKVPPRSDLKNLIRRHLPGL